MALLDLSFVTRSLILLLEEAVAASPAWLPRPRPTISPQPPDKLPADSLGVYLYHLEEDPALKGLPAPVPGGGGRTPVRRTPMGLKLYYQLATGVAEDDNGAYQGQLLLGLAVKAMHDFPVLSDSTEVGGVSLFESLGMDGEGNRFHLTLQAIPAKEAVSFWIAGKVPLRLAAYYQASVVLLEPEESSTRAARVTTLGLSSFVGGVPRLEASENRVTVQAPGVAAPQEVRLQPAEVAPGGRFELRGSGVTGEDVRLRLESHRWSGPKTAGDAWGVLAAPGRVLATARGEIGEGDERVAVLPGLYSVSVEVHPASSSASGAGAASVAGVKPMRSNRVPLTVVPRVDAPLPPPDGDGVLTLTGGVFQHPDLEPDEVEVFAGADKLAAGTAGALEPGEHAVVAPDAIEVRLPAEAMAGGPVPLRVVVSGAESVPVWLPGDGAEAATP